MKFMSKRTEAVAKKIFCKEGWSSESCPEVASASERCREVGSARERCPDMASASERCPDVASAGERCPDVASARERCPEVASASEMFMQARALLVPVISGIGTILFHSLTSNLFNLKLPFAINPSY